MIDENTRPWGFWKVLWDQPYCKVKEVVVKPLQRLSYQNHQKRNETWVIVKGRAIVTLNGQSQDASLHDQIHIPMNTKHRIENPDPENNLVFIEVQTGTYFGEDDIQRFEDDYGRVS